LSTSTPFATQQTCHQTSMYTPAAA
jgi:hypothetical protein